MKLIDMRQRELLLQEWSEDNTLSIADLLISHNYITKDQLKTLVTLLKLGLFEEELKSSKSSIVYKTFASDLYQNEESRPVDINEFTDTEDDADFASYFIKRNIGRGGLGLVNLYHDNSLNRDVAIKEIRKELLDNIDQRQLMRFIQEAQITGQLQHPAIVAIYELSIKPNGKPYFVMKYVQGNSMEDELKKAQNMETEDARFSARMKLLEPLISVCEAVAYAHEKGVVHRDLKPSNIILGKFGETVILDWGLSKYIDQPENNLTTTQRIVRSDTVAKRLTDNKCPELTQADELVGTPAYMSPEQVDESFGDVDQRSDVHALGVILYRILTGRMPYVAENVSTLLDLIADKNVIPPDPAQYYGAIPPELVVICKKAMSKNKDDRFENALGMALELEAFRDGRTVSIYEYTQREMIKRYIKRNRYTLLAALLICVTILVATVEVRHYSSLSADRAKAAQDAELIAQNEVKKVEALRNDYNARISKADRRLAELYKVSNSLLKITADVSSEIRTEFGNYLSSFDFSRLNDLYEQGLTTPGVKSKINDQIRDFMASHKEVVACYVLSNDGLTSWSIPGNRDNLTFLTDPGTTAAAHTYSSCLKTHKMTMFQTTKGSSNSYLMVTIPKDGTNVLGSLIVEYSASTLAGMLIKTDIPQNVRLFVVQNDGTIIFDSTHKEVNAVLDSGQSTTPTYYKELYKCLNEDELGTKSFTIDPNDISVFGIRIQCAWITQQLMSDVKWSVIVSKSVPKNDYSDGNK